MSTKPRGVGPNENAHNKAFGGLAGVNIPIDIDHQIRVRRAQNFLRGMHHHAFRCRNSEETRQFYEDVLGLPLGVAVIQNRDFDSDKGNFCHLFFELGDGSFLAFFECIGEGMITREYRPDSGYDHHVAFYVEGDHVIDEFKRRLDKANVPYSYMDHEVYHSLYFNDPNGLNIELVTNTPVTPEFEKKSMQVAHSNLALWMATMHKGTS